MKQSSGRFKSVWDDRGQHASRGRLNRHCFSGSHRSSCGLREGKLILTKVHELLGREGLVVPYPTLHRFARKHCGFGKPAGTVRRIEGTPGEFAEVDFGQLGMLQELGSGRRRVVHGFMMVMGYSRLSCVIPVFRQDLVTVIDCFEEAFEFFGGCARRVVIDGNESMCG